MLIHGFSGSGAYFIRNAPLLAAAGYGVVCPDLRGHGDSQTTEGGYHVARLAADLRDLVVHLRDQHQRQHPQQQPPRLVPVGCSLGSAVLWTYVELFGSASDFAGLVFVDQAPLQDRSAVDGWDERFAHRGLYDEATLRSAQELWAGGVNRDVMPAARDLVQGCLGYLAKPDAELDREVTPEQREADMAFFTGISVRCDGVWLGRLMEDHTRYDHREAAELINRPTLVLVGGRSGCFPLEGMRETARRVEKTHSGLATWSVFEDAGHWLYYEQPERFHRELVEFIETKV